jgi:hypothetical protein
MRLIRDAGVNYVTIAAEMLNVEYGRTLFLDNGDINPKPTKYPIFIVDGAEVNPRPTKSKIYIGASLSINKFIERLVETICQLTDKVPNETYEKIWYYNDKGLYEFTTLSQGLTIVGVNNEVPKRKINLIRREIIIDGNKFHKYTTNTYLWNINYLFSSCFNSVHTDKLAAIIYDCDNVINAPEEKAMLEIPEFYLVVKHEYRFSHWEFPELELYYGAELHYKNKYTSLPQDIIVYKVPIAELAQIDTTKVTYSEVHTTRRGPCPEICEMCERDLRGDYYILEKKVETTSYLTPICVYCAHYVPTISNLFINRIVYRVVVDYDPSKINIDIIGVCKEMRDDNLRRTVTIKYRGEKINILVTPNYCYLPYGVSAKMITPSMLQLASGPNNEAATLPMMFMQRNINV